jgi:hypothetical protein
MKTKESAMAAKAVEALAGAPNRLGALVGTLRDAVRRERNERQDGYKDVSQGKFVEGLTVRFSAEEANRLCAAVGITPDPIVPLGECDDCANADAGGENRGWDMPCSGCASPKMSNFVPLTALMQKRKLSADEQMLMGNILRGDWWATGFVDRALPPESSQRHTEMAHCHRIAVKAERRGLLRKSHGRLSGWRVTNAGARSLKEARRSAVKARSAA